MVTLFLSWQAWSMILGLSGLILVTIVAKYRIGEKGLPVLSTLISSAAGPFGIAFRSFLVWAFLAKMFRY